MSSSFLLYGANGFVGEAAARLACESGLQPILAGRDADKIKALAGELNLPFQVFALDDSAALDQALKQVSVVLHCAGPYLYTSKPMADACLRNAVHYLDLTGEIPVYAALAERDAEARARGVMLLPGVGFDVVPTDCLALHLKQRLPSATRLTLAFRTQGPAGLPPGTQRTMIEMLPFGNRVRLNGKLETPGRAPVTRQVDFGKGPVQVTRLTWGDVFTAFYSTGIPNIEDYIVLPESSRQQLAILDTLRPFMKLPLLRNLLKRGVKPGATTDQLARSFTHVWGEVTDDEGHTATARLHGPEAGVIWTTRAALAAVRKVVAGNAPPGFQTPAMAYGSDFVLECDGVTREDVN